MEIEVEIIKSTKGLVKGDIKTYQHGMANDLVKLGVAKYIDKDESPDERKVISNPKKENKK